MEAEARPGALNLLAHSLVHVKKAIDLIEQKDEKYDHLTDEDEASLVAKTTEIDQVCLLSFPRQLTVSKHIVSNYLTVMPRRLPGSEKVVFCGTSF